MCGRPCAGTEACTPWQWGPKLCGPCRAASQAQAQLTRGHPPWLPTPCRRVCRMWSTFASCTARSRTSWREPGQVTTYASPAGSLPPSTESRACQLPTCTSGSRGSTRRLCMPCSSGFAAYVGMTAAPCPALVPSSDSCYCCSRQSPQFLSARILCCPLALFNPL